MTDQHQGLRDDIAFMRSLAEAGAYAPMAGGSILVAAGLIFGATALATAYAAANHLIVNGLFFPIVWFAATALFMLCLFLLKRQARPASEAARTMGLAFSGAGWAIFVIVISLMVLCYRAGDWWAMAATAPVIVAIYGCAWVVAAAVSRTRWLFAVAFGAFLSAPLMAWYGLDVPVMFAIYAAVLFGLLALPGLVLMQRARNA